MLREQLSQTFLSSSSHLFYHFLNYMLICFSADRPGEANTIMWKTNGVRSILIILFDLLQPGMMQTALCVF